MFDRLAATVILWWYLASVTAHAAWDRLDKGAIRDPYKVLHVMDVALWVLLGLLIAVDLLTHSWLLLAWSVAMLAVSVGVDAARYRRLRRR
jgi:hypothetical protein